MKKRMMMLSIFILSFISACSSNKVGLEDEAIELYEKQFQDTSENWEVTLHLKEFQIEHLVMEEDIFRFRRLQEIDESIGFQFEMIYGDPIKYSVLMDKTFLSQNQKEYQVKFDQLNIIEEVCFGQFTLNIYWNHGVNESKEESFVFKDHENPMCEYVDRIALWD